MIFVIRMFDYSIVRQSLFICTSLFLAGCYSIFSFALRPDFITRLDIDLNNQEPVTVQVDLQNHKKGRGTIEENKAGPYSIYLCDGSIKAKEAFLSSDLYKLLKARNDTAVFVKGDFPLFKGGLDIHITCSNGMKKHAVFRTWAGPARFRWNEAAIPLGHFRMHKTAEKGLSSLTFRIENRDEALISLIKEPYLLITRGE
jgi:hypothetical protein